MAEVSVVIPAYNEAGSVGATVESVVKAFEGASHEYEIIVVDDGSEDDTADMAEAAGARVVRHPCNIGYGHSIQTGVRAARYPLIATTDADGTYPVHELPAMVEELDRRGLDMLVGARKGRFYHGGIVKRLARAAFKFLSEFTVGRRIPDVNSGLRVIRRELIEDFTSVLCGGFSFSTTITMIAMLSGRFVDFRPISYHERTGRSKVRYFRDVLGTAQILVSAILVFNPVKIFLIFSAGVTAVGGAAAALCFFFPRLAVPVIAAGAFFISACILLGMGFVIEQRRASSRDFNLPRRRFDDDGAPPAGRLTS
ncbi:MAG: glycosyltransferase family 2 protein [bacterium]